MSTAHDSKPKTATVQLSREFHEGGCGGLRRCYGNGESVVHARQLRATTNRQFEYDLLACVRWEMQLKFDKRLDAETRKLQKEIEELKSKFASSKFSVDDASAAELKNEMARQKLKMTNLEYGRKMKLLVCWKNVEMFYDFFSAQLRRVGDTLRRHYGEDARLILEEGLTTSEREWVALSEKLLRDGDDELTPTGRLAKTART